MKSPNCYKCINFYNTFDGSMPHGCRIFGLLSYRFPSSVVKEALGHDCGMFTIKSIVGSRRPIGGGIDPDHKIDIKI